MATTGKTGHAPSVVKATASPPSSSASTKSPHAGLDVAAVQKMFPDHHKANVAKGVPGVERALAEYIDRHKITLSEQQKNSLRVYMYATVRAETGNFLPSEERPNKTNTLTMPYEYRSWGDVILTNFNKYSSENGNTSQRDAENYRGRGYVQLTGKEKYIRYGATAGIPDLVKNPGKASDPDNAARLLVAYIMEKNNRVRILKALDDGDMINARAVVNGGGHRHKPNGMKDFTRAYVQGLEALDPTLRDRTAAAILDGGPQG